MRKNLLLLMTFVFAGLHLPSAALGVTYQYDSLNRLTRVKYDDSNMIHYTYDAAGNRTKMVRSGTACLGDCDGNGQVSISEVQTSINQFLGTADVQSCCDADGDGSVGISEVQTVINNYLQGCD